MSTEGSEAGDPETETQSDAGDVEEASPEGPAHSSRAASAPHTESQPTPATGGTKRRAGLAPPEKAKRGKADALDSLRDKLA